MPRGRAHRGSGATAGVREEPAVTLGGHYTPGMRTDTDTLSHTRTEPTRGADPRPRPLLLHSRPGTGTAPPRQLQTASRLQDPSDLGFSGPQSPLRPGLDPLCVCGDSGHLRVAWIPRAGAPSACTPVLDRPGLFHSIEQREARGCGVGEQGSLRAKALRDGQSPQDGAHLAARIPMNVFKCAIATMYWGSVAQGLEHWSRKPGVKGLYQFERETGSFL